ncbi:sensor histidine kinase [uncultured Phascolarctobacterium sp.]|uniref:sensor histidine kinase n=1 Tax=uncultured Phascolarctobacterium sp. TaxID=512296 RepID=UPI00260F9C35|nr:ATP-binding protein [uncultured Phascolarctobacterium sp.]
MYDELFWLELLEDTHFILTLIYGVILSAAFVGMERTKANYMKLGYFTVISAILQFLTFEYLGNARALQLYPLLIHVPLIIFLSYMYKVSYYSSTLAVSMGYLCCQLTKWLGMVGVLFIPEQWFYYAVRIAVTLPLLALLVYYVSPSFAMLVRLPWRELVTLGLMPCVYYIYDYITTVYTKLLYSGNPVIAEFLGFFLCIVYIIFLYIFAHEYLAKKELEIQNKLIEIKVNSTLHELTQTRQMQQQLSIMRHDMRHFMSTARTLIQQGKYAEALQYLGEEQSELESTILQRYCTHEYINAIIIKYSDKCRLKKISFQTEVKLAEILPCSELSFSAILDNALENAWHAVCELPEEQAQISLSLKQNGGKLLLAVKNTYLQKPEFANDRPVSTRSGHGIGTRSIIYNCEKIGGQYQFSLEDKFFVLRIIV